MMQCLLVQGERLSHAVGCAFAACLERKQKREKECGVTATFDASRTTFTREGSFRVTTATEQAEREEIMRHIQDAKGKGLQVVWFFFFFVLTMDNLYKWLIVYAENKGLTSPQTPIVLGKTRLITWCSMLVIRWTFNVRVKIWNDPSCLHFPTCLLENHKTLIHVWMQLEKASTFCLFFLAGRLKGLL